jgi:hypothetical protein
LLGLGVCEDVQAAALAEEGVCAFGDAAELMPEPGSVGVAAGGLAVVPGGFGELRLAAREDVLVEGVRGWTPSVRLAARPGSGRVRAVRTRPGRRMA